jgi:hypothetical protein
VVVRSWRAMVLRKKKSQVRSQPTAPSFNHHIPRSPYLPHNNDNPIDSGGYGLNCVVMQALRQSRSSSSTKPDRRKKYYPPLTPGYGTQAYGARLDFRTSSAALVAHNFTMPALSPTMTEGNIASWKVKEGTDIYAPSDIPNVVRLT